MSRTSSSGFTIIELLLVVVIIGMVLAVAVPSLIKSRDAADSAVAMGQLRAMNTNQWMFRLQRERFARLPELNTYAAGALGRTVGSTIRHRDYIYTISPTPTDVTLSTNYQIIAYRIRNGRIVSQHQMNESGMVRTIIP